MDITSNSVSQQNNSAASAGINIASVQNRDNSTQKINPAKESAGTGSDIRKSFDQESLVRDAVSKKIIKDEKQLFNFRVTRYENNLTFTDVSSGSVTNVGLSSVVGSNAVNTAV